LSSHFRPNSSLIKKHWVDRVAAHELDFYINIPKPYQGKGSQHGLIRDQDLVFSNCIAVIRQEPPPPPQPHPNPEPLYDDDFEELEIVGMPGGLFDAGGEFSDPEEEEAAQPAAPPPAVIQALPQGTGTLTLQQMLANDPKPHPLWHVDRTTFLLELQKPGGLWDIIPQLLAKMPKVRKALGMPFVQEVLVRNFDITDDFCWRGITSVGIQSALTYTVNNQKQLLRKGWL
jgi:hypothetical protein